MGFLSWKNKTGSVEERTKRTVPVDPESVEEVERALRPINAAPEAPEPSATQERKPEAGQAEAQDVRAGTDTAGTTVAEEPSAGTTPSAEPAATPEPKTAAPGREAEQAAAAVSEQAAAVVPEQPSTEAETAPPVQPRLKPMDLIAPTRHDVPGFPRAGGPAPGDESARNEKPVAEAKVISFANQKGGVAKTTTTLNLAVAFAEAGHSVLCVDLDPQGNLTMSQGIDPDRVETSMYDVLVHDVPMIDVIVEREIDIAVASIDLAGAEIAMSTKIGRERSLEKALKEVKPFYDFICIDTPPSLGLLTINALTASDKVIVPVQCEYLSMRGLVQLQNTLRMIQENLNPNVQIEGILPTMLDSRTVHAKEAIEILEENFGDLVFKSRIRKAIKFAEAPVRGSSVLKYDPQGNAANCYRDLAKEVLTHGKA